VRSGTLSSSKTRTRVAKLLLGFFGDPGKVSLWMSSPNPLLGNVSPEDMIRIGREEKLLRFVENQLRENEAPRA
jgi:antitoxin Xre/MbcA/ParS-like protein